MKKTDPDPLDAPFPLLDPEKEIEALHESMLASHPTPCEDDPPAILVIMEWLGDKLVRRRAVAVELPDEGRDEFLEEIGRAAAKDEIPMIGLLFQATAYCLRTEHPEDVERVSADPRSEEVVIYEMVCLGRGKPRYMVAMSKVERSSESEPICAFGKLEVKDLSENMRTCDGMALTAYRAYVEECVA